MSAQNTNPKHRMRMLGLLGILALNSWFAQQDERVATEMSSSSKPIVAGQRDGLNGNSIAEALGSCAQSGQCDVTVTQQSGASRVSNEYRVTLSKADVPGGEDFLGNKIEAGTGAKITIALVGCASCVTTRIVRTRDPVALIAEAAKHIDSDSKRAAKDKEQERLAKIAREKLDKAVAACEKGDSGEVDTKGMPVGKTLNRTERLECMKDHMAGLDDKEQQAYFETTLLPLLNSMIDPSSTAADRDAVRSFAKGFDVGNRGIMDSVRVMARASLYQDRVLQLVGNLRANPRNEVALMELTRLQGQISSELGPMGGHATAIGAQLGSLLTSRFQHQLSSAADGVRMHQMRQMQMYQQQQGQMHSRHYDPRYPQHRFAGGHHHNRPGPVPRPGYAPDGRQVIASGGDRAVWEDPCYNGRSATGESCTYAPSGTSPTVDPVLIDL